MWLLVSVIRGSKYFEPDSQVGNRVIISDASDLVISGRAMGGDGYRFEARKGGESFIISEFAGNQPAGALEAQFVALARQLGAVGSAAPG